VNYKHIVWATVIYVGEIEHCFVDYAKPGKSLWISDVIAEIHGDIVHEGPIATKLSKQA